MKPLLVVPTPDLKQPAEQLAGHYYDVMSYTEAIKSPLADRNVLWWNDSGKGNTYKSKMLAKKSKETKSIIPESGINARSVLEKGWTWETFLEWAKPRAAVILYLPDEDDNPRVNESQFVLVERLGLMAPNQKVICNSANVVRLLKNHEEYAGRIWYDEFYKTVVTNLGGERRAWIDADTNKLCVYLQDQVGMFRITKGQVDDGVNYYAHTDTRNEPKDWMTYLIEWDKTPRIADFFNHCMGAPPSAYTSAASHNFWVGMVARILSPGCQNDHMVVLEGPQNSGKTSALRLIGGKWYAEASESVQSKDFFLTLKGHILVEIAELDAFGRAEVNRIKQVISCPVDVYREPYGRRTCEYPRTCILVGTTNDDAYLRDVTGARRFWPIQCGDINLDLIRSLRDQLFAEAVHAYKAGETWHHMPKDETEEVQESRRDRDTWEDVLKPKLETRSYVTMAEVAELVGITIDKLDKRTQLRLAWALKKLNFRRDMRRIDGKLTRGWEPIGG